ncbi:MULTISPECIES: IS3 family transposase [unclassified Streptomyces]|uniref:IS3 family transposase n=1 Tax=Streptomyces sp. NPDC055082 TaxID=3365718 RepID=UPI0037CD1D2C
MTASYRLIHAEKANYPVTMLCRVLHVTRSSYYAWREGEAARQASDDALAHEITMLHIASRKTYGAPRIHAELRWAGRRVNRERFARVMRERPFMLRIAKGWVRGCGLREPAVPAVRSDGTPAFRAGSGTSSGQVGLSGG